MEAVGYTEFQSTNIGASPAESISPHAFSIGGPLADRRFLMSRDEHSPQGKNVAVIGSTGGIGTALCARLLQDPATATLHSLSRNPQSIADSRVRALSLDLCDERSISRAADKVAASGPLDLVIVATGILHEGHMQPEKSLRDIDAEKMRRVIEVNTIGPALLAKHFLPHMRRQGKSVFAAISARVGSIGDNRLGGWVSYRASKAALNMVLKTMAVEHARRWPDGIIAALHPGTVATDLSQPFSSRVPADKLFSADTSAAHLLSVIDQLRPGDSGGFFAWDGSPIQY